MSFNQFKTSTEDGLTTSDQSHLHVILPAKEINVLNPSKNNQSYNSNYDDQKEKFDNGELYVEIGCKIDSVEYLLRSDNQKSWFQYIIFRNYMKKV